MFVWDGLGGERLYSLLLSNQGNLCDFLNSLASYGRGDTAVRWGGGGLKATGCSCFPFWSDMSCLCVSQ